MASNLEIGYFRKSNGANIAYGIAGEGRPVVVIPGWVNSLDAIGTFDSLFDYLAARFRAITYDKQGTGLSERKLGQRRDQGRHTDEVVELLDHLSLDRVALYGGSQAGPIAIEFAARYPERISHLVLCATYASGPETFYKPDVREAMLSIVRSHWGIASRTLADTFMPRATAEELDAFAHWQRSSASAETAALLLEEVYSADVSDLLASVRAPTLVIHRRGDRAVPFRGGQAIAAGIRGARLMPLEGSVHGLGSESDVPAALEAIGIFLGAGGTSTISRRASRSASQPFRTILFSDVVASTPLLARLGDSRMRDVMREHDALMEASVAGHGGRVIKTIGDAFMAEFGLPSAAVEAAIAAQRAIRERFDTHDIPVRIRIGINSGEPIEEDGDLHGASVVIAKRLESLAGDSGILVSDIVKQAVAGKGFGFEDRGPVALKGFDEQIRAWAVRWE